MTSTPLRAVDDDDKALVRDSRRAPFMWMGLAELDAIDRHIPESQRAGALVVYLALARAAALDRDGTHTGFQASRRDLAGLAGVSVRSFDAHVRQLAELGLAVVQPNRDEQGRSLASSYALTALQSLPHNPDQGGAAGGATVAPQGAKKRADFAPPTRARHNGVEEVKKELLPPTPEGKVPDSRGEERQTPRASRSDARSVACPACKAPPGVACTGRDGPRVQHHEARHESAIAAGAQPISVPHSPGSGRQPRPEEPAGAFDPAAPLPPPPDSDRQRWQQQWDTAAVAWCAAHGITGPAGAVRAACRRLELWRAPSGAHAAEFVTAQVAAFPVVLNGVRVEVASCPEPA